MDGYDDTGYLGDGVYVEFDGYHIWLSTQEGHKIALEPDVFSALKAYAKKLNKKYNTERY